MIKSSIIFIILSKLVSSQDFQIEDIPIESYDQASRQENDMDLELLPRQHRSFNDPDPKEYFFRTMRSFDDDDDIRTFGPYSNIPRPITFTTIYSNIKNNKEETLARKKRNINDETANVESSTEITKDKNELIFSLGKPLEIANLDAAETTTPVLETKPEKRDEENVLINDFIRFRRSANQEPRNNSDYPEKISLDRNDDEINRETRGITKEQWMRQAYPVRKRDEMAFNDNIPMSSENMRIARVHYLGKPSEENALRAEFRPSTREARGFNNFPLEENALRAEFRPYSREARGFGDLRPRDQYIEPDFYRPRFAAPYYGAERSGYPMRFERDPPIPYRPRYENFEPPRTYNLGALKKPQKRIIYYATLPEVSRTNPDLGDRPYPYDRYEDRYFQDPYRYRKGGYPKSSRYEEGKTPFPVKVSTDVNVREVKKNPERRIYSEIDRNRYAYSTPYPPEG